MQRHKHIIFAITLLALAACNKSVSNRTDNLPALSPASEDLNAGTWKPVLLSRPDTFAVAAPVATTNASYTADREEIKADQANLTSDMKTQISYWSAGHVLRWNEIMMNLVTKYNLPPYTDS